jgi:hypothetical protein
MQLPCLSLETPRQALCFKHSEKRSGSTCLLKRSAFLEPIALLRVAAWHGSGGADGEGLFATLEMPSQRVGRAVRHLPGV